MNMEQGARSGAPLNTPTGQRTSIKAIQTRYKGYHFRSRLEARWAVFFDALGVPWEYEPEGFATSIGPYLPDFRIKLNGYPCWFEVKPDGAPEDDRHRVLCVETATPLIVARGIPGSYREQLKGSSSPLTAMFWGDRLDGARVPAGDARPSQYSCAFIGNERYRRNDANEGTCPGYWDNISKARPFLCDSLWDWHVALYMPNADHVHRVPADCDDVDAAYRAARSARFEHGQSGSSVAGEGIPFRPYRAAGR